MLAAISLLTTVSPLVRGCDGALGAVAAVTSTVQQSRPRLWHILEEQPQAWNTIFGASGERGEYMDAYGKQAMLDRCMEDYNWGDKFSTREIPAERAHMMSHLYDNAQLWEYVSMVGFAEHYILDLTDDEDVTQPFAVFQKHQGSQPAEKPIFSGVVFDDWQNVASPAAEQKIAAFKEKGIDYIRLHCNFGSADKIGGAAKLAKSPLLAQLAEVAHICQKQEMVPLVLIMVPWREPGTDSRDYFKQVGLFHPSVALGPELLFPPLSCMSPCVLVMRQKS